MLTRGSVVLLVWAMAWPIAILAQSVPDTATAGERAEPGINQGRIMWSAFTCSTYAELAEDDAEQLRLFNVGYESGQAFLTSIEDETISEEEFQATPVAVLLLLGGPTVDFILGRVFESAAGYAYDNVVKRDSFGRLLTDPSEWADDELTVQRARTRYHQSNCAVVR